MQLWFISYFKKNIKFFFSLISSVNAYLYSVNYVPVLAFSIKMLSFFAHSDSILAAFLVLWKAKT